MITKQDREELEDWCCDDAPNCGCGPSSSAPAGYVAEFNRMQKKKMDYLIKTGGNFSGAVTAYIGFPDGRLATVDPFGRVTWKAT